MNYIILIKQKFRRGLGIGDCGLENGDWGLGVIRNAEIPIPNTHYPYNTTKL